MRDRAHQVFFERIVLCVGIGQFRAIGDDLFPNRVPFLFDGGQHGGCNPHGVVPHDVFNLFRVDPEPLGQVFRFHHTVGQDASPILHWFILSLMPDRYLEP